MWVDVGRKMDYKRNSNIFISHELDKGQHRNKRFWVWLKITNLFRMKQDVMQVNKKDKELRKDNVSNVLKCV